MIPGGPSFQYVKNLEADAVAYRARLATSENEIKHLLAREDRLLRAAIDAAWGEALEDGSVPSTKKQDWIIAYARSVADGQSEIINLQNSTPTSTAPKSET